MARLIEQTSSFVSRGIVRVWFGIMLLMTVTGMGQMPIFKRYYIADIPGLGWLADPYVVHWVHYLGAIALMGLGAWLVPVFLSQRFRFRFTASGVVRLVLLALIIITGYMRVAKNLPGFHWSAALTVFIDWSHLGFAMLLGIAAIMARLRGSAAYVRLR
ncbi:iron-sulfur cluster-binding protein [Desulfovibrio mangrovi]|uniref:iron-sulfur cluster-binding protein n=1 Tax=Desulfovibrio mangrovi TaxID=2976983 RepID=UPI00224856C4|nr:iron-sulfur cluster-binding protein [Desulfovibrio mangrovi]UZP67064.1 iron-sulfur cluster-binding protein [Desulfovibrio mangrovi]